MEIDIDYEDLRPLCDLMSRYQVKAPVSGPQVLEHPQPARPDVQGSIVTGLAMRLSEATTQSENDDRANTGTLEIECRTNPHERKFHRALLFLWEVDCGFNAAREERFCP
jgi:hypothetical protein